MTLYGTDSAIDDLKENAGKVNSKERILALVTVAKGRSLLVWG